jgi:trehalose 6-phosphate phosphatase
MAESSGDATVPYDKVWRLVSARNVALFLDIDGTLLDLAPTPTSVRVPRALVESLTRADRKLDGALALVSGRAIDEIDHLFEPLRLRASGVHGAQIRLHPDTPAQVVGAASTLPDSLAASVQEAVRHFPGILIENKRFSLAVHYRLNPQAARWLRVTLQELIAAAPPGDIEIEEAHSAFELKSPKYDKGKAIALFLSEEPFRGRTPVFVGDDTTDEAGFAEVTARGGWAYSVGQRRPGVTGFFDSPGIVRDWLAAFARGEAG